MMNYLIYFINKIVTQICLYLVNYNNSVANYQAIEDLPITRSTNIDNIQSRTNDADLINIQSRIKQHNLGVGQRFHKDFYSFLELHPDMYHRYIILSTARHPSSIEEMDSLVKAFHKIRTLYTFKQLYAIDPEWYLFFKENTDQHGNTKPGEGRVGVDRQYVDNIMTIKRMSTCECDILNATSVYTNVLYRIFSSELPRDPQ